MWHFMTLCVKIRGVRGELMFSKKLFNPNIEPRCCYCEHASETSDGMAMLCKKRGIMTKDYYCGKFIYDPLKRDPVRPPRLQRFDPKDFSL